MKGRKLDKKGKSQKGLKFWGSLMMPLPKIGKISFPLHLR